MSHTIKFDELGIFSKKTHFSGGVYGPLGTIDDDSDIYIYIYTYR